MTKKPPPGLSDKDRQEWEAIAREVKPIRKTKAAPPPPKKITIQPPRQEAGNYRIIDVTSSQPPALDRKIKRKIANRRIPIDATLDLHGMTLQEAWEYMFAALMQAADQNFRTLLVVTGRGRDGQGALRKALPGWLESDRLRDKIAGWESADRSHGGDGAFYVRLKRRRHYE